MRISEFCGLTISDLDMENRIIDINKQLQRTSSMEYIVSSTKTNAGARKIPMTEEVFQCFQAILEDREPPAVEYMVDGHVGFLYLDDQGLPLVAMHWEHRFNLVWFAGITTSSGCRCQISPRTFVGIHTAATRPGPG